MNGLLISYVSNRLLSVATLSFLSLSAPVLAQQSGSFNVFANRKLGASFTNSGSGLFKATFLVSGKWSSIPGRNNGASGLPEVPVAGSAYTLSSAPAASLIVRRGNGNYEFVGTERTMILQGGEKLFFSINDGNDSNGYSDNTGDLLIEWVGNKIGNSNSDF